MYKPEGDIKTCKYIMIGEAPARRELITGRPFMGDAGGVFDECLDKAEIIRSQCYITNVFDFRVVKPKKKSKVYVWKEDENEPPEYRLLFTSNKGFTLLGMESVERLKKEIENSNANVIVPMGNIAMDALCGRREIMKWRGSILESTLMCETVSSGDNTIRQCRKCIPTIHPANALYGQYLSRYLITDDFKKAVKQSEFPEIIRPNYNFKLFPTFSECISILNWIREKKLISVDIEVASGKVSRISYAWSALDAISIPYGDGNWTDEEETLLWIETAKTLETEGIVKIFQNGPFDTHFLFNYHNIKVAGPIEDTMVAHSLLYPDFRKSLAFMTSIRTEQPYYKDIVKHGDVEKDDG